MKTLWIRFVNLQTVSTDCATELSYQDTTIDMQPPEFKFDSSIDGEGEFYVLPVYIDGKHSDLIVKLG